MVLSIIMPCYNHGQYLEEAIDSIIEVYKDNRIKYEIIIVNDGSTDADTIRVLSLLNNNKVIVINQHNQGLAAARNNGVKVAKGKYILPLDSDNKLTSGYLVDAIEILDSNPEVDIIYGNPVFFGDDSGEKVIGEFNFKKILLTNYIDACAVYRREMWQEAQGYDGAMPFMGNEDWELWIHMFLLDGRFFYLNQVCFHYRVLPNSMSVTTTRPGFIANKNYIYVKHAVSIIENILSDVMHSEQLNIFYNKNKVRTAFKLLLGKSL